MNALAIGTYVERRSTATNAPQTKPHFVESVVDDEPICHCGRTLKRLRRTDFVEVAGAGACKQCGMR